MKKMNKKTLVLLIAIAALMTASIGGTVAWLATSSGPITNTFDPAQVDVSVTDKIVNGTKQDVVITNNRDIPVYIRVAVVANWCDEDGNIVAPWHDCEKLPVDTSKWERDGNYFYYNGTVAAGDIVELFNDGASYSAVRNTDYPDAHLEMDIIAQAIQAQGGAVDGPTNWTITNPSTN